MRFIAAAFALLSAFAAGEEGLKEKVLCGYQGWFRTPSDGTNNGWHHYANGKTFEPATCAIDAWPDVRELPASSRVSTPFRHPDGSTAEVFNSVDPAVIDLHFRWMREYGINGVFLQRFATTARDPRFRGPMDRVLDGVAKSAQTHGREWAIMYDLTGLKTGEMRSVMDDWKRLRDTHPIADRAAHPTYLRYGGKPLVALWGCGFSDRDPMLEEWKELIAFLKSDPLHGGCAIMLGVPTYWRMLDRDAVKDPVLHEIIASVDVVSPWTVGRFDRPERAVKFAKEVVAADVEWCKAKNIEYLPVAFPGFSWHNLSARRGQKAPANAIPRLGGQFLWSQFAAYRQAGAQALYVAMFDEVDEATAIFKLRQDPPSTPETPFIGEPGVPEDYYLWLTGQASRLLKGEIANQEDLPQRARGK